MLNPQQISLQIAEKVRELATRQSVVPFLTGDLRKSLIVRPLGTAGAVLGSNLPYARAVHDGRPALTIRAKKGKALVFWADGRLGKSGRPAPFPKDKKAFRAAVASGDLIVASVVHQPARQGRPFLTDAVATLRREGLGWLAPKIGAELAKDLEAALRANSMITRR